MHLLADATYNLIIKNFPVLTVGTSDRNKAMHPFGLAVTSHEDEHDYFYLFESIRAGCKKIFNFNYNPNILIAENADSITNGFSRVFENLKRYFKLLKYFSCCLLLTNQFFID